MKLIYLYDDGSRLSITGKSERDCANKIKDGAEKKRSEEKNLVRIDRPRTKLEIVADN